MYIYVVLGMTLASHSLAPPANVHPPWRREFETSIHSPKLFGKRWKSIIYRLRHIFTEEVTSRMTVDLLFRTISFPITEINESILLHDSNLLRESIIETPSEIPVPEQLQRRTWVETIRQEGETLKYVDRLVIGNQLWWALRWGQILLSKFSGIWGDLVDKVILIDQGAFLIRFNFENDLQSPMRRGPILFDKRPIIMKKWSPNLKLREEEVQSVDIWIRLPRLHVKYWGNLSKIANMVYIISMSAQLIHAHMLVGSKLVSRNMRLFTCIFVHLTGYKHGDLPIKYHGVPLTPTKLTKSDAQVLLDKITNRIQSWARKRLFYARRVQLVNSVLLSMHIYWPLIFLLLKYVVHQVEQTCRMFLWGGDAVNEKISLVSGDLVCKPKYKGGLSIKGVGKWNTSLIGRYVWNIACEEDTLWVRWVHHVYLKRNTWWEYKCPGDASWVWTQIVKVKEILRQGSDNNTGKWKGITSGLYTVALGYN
ncbi:hypothetical protein Cgig2_031570 [Carnegiea gigantea]|uniref:DUF4283 domain-containing protein n=1 Tax=Carnegiea gigantea TaxID=171969 RepID=A0A9Q1JG36_9CARY|nr:hypothetical protein Cgig2_031570 [Carnegiea gigantea]